MSTPESIWRERIKKNAQIHSTLGNLRTLLAVLLSALSTALLLMTGLLPPTNFWWVVALMGCAISFFVLFMLLFEYLNPSPWALFVLVRLGVWKSFTAQDFMFYREQEKTFKQGGWLEQGRWLDGCE